MSEEQGEAVSEIAAGKEPAPESITQQQENHQQPATAADEKGNLIEDSRAPHIVYSYILVCR